MSTIPVSHIPRSPEVVQCTCHLGGFLPCPVHGPAVSASVPAPDLDPAPWRVVRYEVDGEPYWRVTLRKDWDGQGTIVYIGATEQSTVARQQELIREWRTETARLVAQRVAQENAQADPLAEPCPPEVEAEGPAPAPTQPAEGWWQQAGKAARAAFESALHEGYGGADAWVETAQSIVNDYAEHQAEQGHYLWAAHQHTPPSRIDTTAPPPAPTRVHPSGQPIGDGVVQHPAHYNQVPGIECIDVIEHFDLLTGTAIKYLWRAGRKVGVARATDLRKAAYYVQRAIERERLSDDVVSSTVAGEVAVADGKE